MSAITGTKNCQLLEIYYNVNSEELTRIDVSTSGNLELGFELTSEMQPTALMIFTSVFPKKYEAFQARHRKLDKDEAALPLRVIASADSWKVFSARDLQRLRQRGIIGEDE